MKHNPEEPEVVINGVKLSEAMTMTLRAALNSFAFELNGPDQGLGEPLRLGYLMQLAEIQRLLSEATL